MRIVKTDYADSYHIIIVTSEDLSGERASHNKMERVGWVSCGFRRKRPVMMREQSIILKETLIYWLEKCKSIRKFVFLLL